MTGRWCVLGRPWFLGALALLAVNDHVWKQDHPGLITGKLSDVAGVAVVAAIAAAVLGRTSGLVAVGLGFTLLKTVPGVAELAAPILGGVTRRDPLDLVALLVLVPVWFALGDRSPQDDQPPGRHPDRDPADSEPGRSTSDRRPRTSGPVLRRAAGTALPILGACAALVVTTATSCSPEPAVIRVVAVGDTAYAYVDGGFDEDGWARSDDGGRSWRDSAAPPGVDPDAPAGIPIPSTSTTSSPPTTTTFPTTVLEDGGSSTTSTTEPRTGGPYDDSVLGPVEDCNATECFRVVDGRAIQRAPVGTEQWRDEFVLSVDDVEDFDTGCTGGTKGILASVAALDSPGGAVASLGGGGVASRNTEGAWDRHAVLDADAGESTFSLDGPAFWVVLASLPLGMAAAWAVGRRGSALRIVGTVMVPVSLLILVGCSLFFVALLEQDDPEFRRMQVIAAGVSLLIGVGISALSRTTPPPPVRPGPDHRPHPPRPNPPRPNPPAPGPWS